MSTTRLAAQSTSARGGAAASAPAESDIVTLSPFEVNTDRDIGYQAVSSLAGGRIDTPLDQTPAALTILTREFLDDIAANNFLDAALWSPNSATAPANPESSDFRVDFRSSGTGSTPTVNYFNFPVQMDSFTTERIEFSRGPNSILFGQGNLSGIATVSLKQPRFRNFGQVQFRFDNFETRRASLDVNRQFFDGKAAVRFAALRQDGQRWRENNPDDRRGYFLAGVARLGDSVALRFEAEYGEQTRTFSEGQYFDNASSWTGVAYNGNGRTPMPVPPNQGMQAFPGNADYLVFIPSRPDLGVLNHRGFARTTGAQNFPLIPDGRPYIPNFPALPHYGFDLQPPNSLVRLNYYFTTLYFEKRFSPDFFVQLSVNQRNVERDRTGANTMGGNWTALRRDPNAFLPTGAPNPDFGRFYIDGEPTRQRQSETPRDYRLLATYRFENTWMQHRLSGYLSHQRTRGEIISERFVRVDDPANPSPTSGSNFIQQRYFFDDPSPRPFAFDAAAFPGLSVRSYRFGETRSGSDGFTAQAAAVSSYWRGKLTTIVGFRRDDTDRYEIDSDPHPPTGTLLFTRRDFGEAIGTTSAGGVWYPVPHFGPFFNYSESFSAVPQGEPLINSGGQPDVPRGQTREFGVYFKLLGDRLQGSLRYYDSIQRGRIVNAPGAPNINAIWQQLGLTQNQLVGPVRDTNTLESSGYEFELTANLTRNWRTLLNFSVPRSTQRDSFSETIAYRARFLAQWEAAAATNSQIANSLEALNSAILAGADGREQNSQLDYRANVYTSYDFRAGPLRGFGFGAGANFFGAQIAGNVFNEPFNYIKKESYTLASAHVSYRGRWREFGYRIQLNVTNAFDKHILNYTDVARYNPPPPPPGSGAGAATGVPGDYLARFRYVDPRKVTLTTTLEF